MELFTILPGFWFSTKSWGLYSFLCISRLALVLVLLQFVFMPFCRSKLVVSVWCWWILRLVFMRFCRSLASLTQYDPTIEFFAPSCCNPWSSNLINHLIWNLSGAKLSFLRSGILENSFQEHRFFHYHFGCLSNIKFGMVSISFSFLLHVFLQECVNGTRQPQDTS